MKRLLDGHGPVGQGRNREEEERVRGERYQVKAEKTTSTMTPDQEVSAEVSGEGQGHVVRKFMNARVCTRNPDTHQGMAGQGGLSH